MQRLQTHTEFFPIASWFLAKATRKPIVTIYNFARTADNIADEGEALPDERLLQLTQHTQNITDICAEYPELPNHLFLDLISAFKQDVVKQSYQSFQEILDYARLSANPIGRLLLHLHHISAINYFIASDALCTALQFINILNDIEEDWRLRHRCYLPQDEMRALYLCEEEFAKQNPISQSFQKLLNQQFNRVDHLLNDALPLAELTGRFGFELRIVIQCAKRMTRKLRKRTNLNKRLKLTFLDWVKIYCKTVYNSFKLRTP